MRRALLPLAIACWSCGALGGGPGPEDVGDVPRGTLIAARLELPLWARYAHLGEPVRARTLTELQTAEGHVVVPRGALFIGEVSDRATSSIWIKLDRLVFDGVTQRVHARIVGTETGFSGRLHTGDEVVVRLDSGAWSRQALQSRAPRQ